MSPRSRSVELAWDRAAGCIGCGAAGGTCHYAGCRRPGWRDPLCTLAGPHRCARNDGQPIAQGQECFARTAAESAAWAAALGRGER